MSRQDLTLPGCGRKFAWHHLATVVAMEAMHRAYDVTQYPSDLTSWYNVPRDEKEGYLYSLLDAMYAAYPDGMAYTARVYLYGSSYDGAQDQIGQRFARFH
jgi:hypothetical protein